MTWDTNTSILRKLETFSADTAWSLLASEFRTPIQRFAQRSGLPAAVADDVVQDTLVVFARKYREGAYDREKGRLSSWLFGIARHQVQAAKRQGLRKDEPLDEAEPQAPDELAALWEAEWQTHRMTRCIARVKKEVNARTFDAFRLVALEGRSPDEAAAQLGVARTNVYNAVHRIKERLRELAHSLEED